MEGARLVVIYGKVTALLEFSQIHFHSSWSGSAHTELVETHVGRRRLRRPRVARWSERKTLLGTSIGSSFPPEKNHLVTSGFCSCLSFERKPGTFRPPALTPAYRSDPNTPRSLCVVLKKSSFYNANIYPSLPMNASPLKMNNDEVSHAKVSMLKAEDDEARHLSRSF